MLTASGYKCDLLTIESRSIRNVGNLFFVSFSQLLTRYSAATFYVRKNNYQKLKVIEENQYVHFELVTLSITSYTEAF